MTLCTWQTGWRSLLLRGYKEPVEVEDLVTAPTQDQLIVLVSEGSCRIEGRYAGRWHEARYTRGAIAMTAPGEEVHLRWREGHNKKTLQLHLPAAIFADAVSFDPGNQYGARLPNHLFLPDSTIENVMLGLQRAANANAPELYAESAVHFLASHLVQFHAGVSNMPRAGMESRRMAQADALLRESVASDVSLDQLASAVNISKFHLLRVFKTTYGETPFRRLTRHRMEAARALLQNNDRSISSIAYACGYDNPTHFATAFRRFHGVSPKVFRDCIKPRPQSCDRE